MRIERRVRKEFRVLEQGDISTAEQDGLLHRAQRETRAMRRARSQLRAASASVAAVAPDSARWFCLVVGRGREFAVEKVLAAAGVDVLLPRETVVSVRRGRKIEGERPLLPGYLLVRFAPSAAAFAGLRRQKGVVDFVRCGESFLTVPSAHVLVFKKVEPAEICSLPADRSIGPGCAAEIVTGPFVGWRCTVLGVEWRRTARARVSIDMSGRVYEIGNMPLAFLKKL